MGVDSWASFAVSNRPTEVRTPPPGQLPREQYALRMKRLSTFIKGLTGRRPPTGPLTTAETTDAEELRQETRAKDKERLEREQKDASDHEV